MSKKRVVGSFHSDPKAILEFYTGKANETELKQFLEEAASAYFNTESLLVSDDVFDKLVKHYETTFGKEFQIGAPVEVGNTLELSHTYKNFAGTLSKAQSFDDLRAWVDKNSFDPEGFIISPKLDGFSLTVEFKVVGENIHTIDKAMTRGADGVGKDLTALIRSLSNIVPRPYDYYDNDYAVAYEVVMSQEALDQVNALEIFEEGKNQPITFSFKNRRSAIAGALSEAYSKYLGKYLTFQPLRMISKDDETSRIEDCEELNSIQPYHDFFAGADLMDIYSIYEAITNFRNGKITADELPEAYQEILSSFMCDGLVVEISDQGMRKRLGYTNATPNFAIALKFPPMEATTQVRSVLWSSEGNTQVFTPVITFDPVIMNGNTYTKVSVANYGRFMREQFRVGDKLTFSLSNDVLGYITKQSGQEGNTEKLLEVLDKCPHCGTPLEVIKGKGKDPVTGEPVGDILYDPNPECVLALKGNLAKQAEALKVKYLGPAAIDIIVESGAYKNYIDFWMFDYSLFKDKLGEGNTKRLQEEIGKLKSKPIPANRILASFNYPLVSTSNSKTILKHYHLTELNDKSLESRDKLVKEFAEIHGVGNEIANSLVNLLKNFHVTEVLDYILEELEVEEHKCEGGKKPSEVLTFCHTGSSSPIAKRDLLKDVIEAEGHKFVGSVTNKTSYLINNDISSTTGKNAKAKELGIPIISVKEALELIGVNV